MFSLFVHQLDFDRWIETPRMYIDPLGLFYSHMSGRRRLFDYSAVEARVLAEFVSHLDPKVIDEFCKVGGDEAQQAKLREIIEQYGHSSS